MPVISRFMGFDISMHYGADEPPHFCVRHSGYRVILGIGETTVAQGDMPGDRLTTVWGWARRHEKELMANWEACRAGLPVQQIPGLVGRLPAEVEEVAPLGQHRLRIRFVDGLDGELDVAREFRMDGILAGLADETLFARVRVDAETRTLAWPNGADLDPDKLYRILEKRVYENWREPEAARKSTPPETGATVKERINAYAEAHKEELIEAYSKLPESDGGRIISEAGFEKLLFEWLVRDGVLPSFRKHFAYGDKAMERYVFGCHECGWTGLAAEARTRSYYFLKAVCCPECGEELGGMNLTELREQELYKELPELNFESFALSWVLKEVDGEREWWIMFGDGLVGRLQAFYEDASLFRLAARVLKRKYGRRIRDLIPEDDPNTGTYLYGDDIGSIGRVEEARRWLSEH